MTHIIDTEEHRIKTTIEFYAANILSYGESNDGAIDGESIKGIVDFILQQLTEAQQNAVAWTIKEIDVMHFRDSNMGRDAT